MIFGLPVVAIALLMAALMFAVTNRPRLARSVAIAVILPILLWSPIKGIDEYIHLGLTAGLGLGQLRDTSNLNSSGFTVYDWSVGLISNGNTFLIRDKSDGIVALAAQHKHPSPLGTDWKVECAANLRHLLGHYYVCNF